jgi:hypothetical protein
MNNKAKGLLSRRGYAKRLGITPGAVNKAVLAGKIDMAGDRVDPGGPLSLAYESVQKQRQAAAAEPLARVIPLAARRGPARRVAGPVAVSGGLPAAPSESPTRTKLEADIARLVRVCRRLELQNERMAMATLRRGATLSPQV